MSPRAITSTCLGIAAISTGILLSISWPYEHWWQYLGLSISLLGFFTATYLIIRVN